MHRIDTSTAQRDKFGQGKNGFTRGNPQTGTPATQLDYLYCDAIQEEIANAIESAGIKLDKSKHDQLATAIKEFVKKGSVKLNSSTNSSLETEAATPLAVKKANDLATTAHNIAELAVRRGNEFPFRGNLGGRHLNNIGATSHGVYFQNSYNEALIERGYPVRDAGALTVLKTDGDGESCAQIYTLYKSGRQFIRNYRGNSQNGFWDSWVEQITTANINDYLPVGIPQPWPTTTPPDGWLKCNGWKFDKNKYPKLAQVYPSGNLPDLRGEFIRGWDDGKGTDSGRGILSWQGDAIRNIWGEISPISETFASEPIATGAFKYFEKHAGHTPTSIDVGSVGGVVFDASNIVPTANENRVRSIAFLYIVKAE
ncbi:tail fiber protein [Gilliamella sp. ESL0250]|uniref:tail fiber protein n=1 Tax=Gilliamella sp. ESL0250 TaxID=2705036 RepID=UPI0015D30941|nr:tail fiber protein [Gilliamella sp. ESL0250]NUF50058.1 tail fiber protein [Gilliamella sp. ESL0250]